MSMGEITNEVAGEVRGHIEAGVRQGIRRMNEQKKEALQLFFHSDRSVGLTRAQIAKGEGQCENCIRGLCGCDDG